MTTKLQVFISLNDTATEIDRNSSSTVENGPRKIAPDTASSIGNFNNYLNLPTSPPPMSCTLRQLFNERSVTSSFPARVQANENNILPRISHGKQTNLISCNFSVNL